MSSLLPREGALWTPKYYTKPLKLKDGSYNELTDGDKASAFAEAFLTTDQGVKAGEPLVLDEWQNFVVRNALEINPETGYRRYRIFLILLPRKNGKTLLVSVILGYLFIENKPTKKQIVNAASSAKQAKLVYNYLHHQFQKSPYFKKQVRSNKKEATNLLNGSVMQPIAANINTAQGLEVTAASADELHKWEGKYSDETATEFWNAITNSAGALPESLVLGISTAGNNKYNFLGQLRDYAIKVATGEIVDDTFGVAIWEPDDGDDPLDEKTWLKVNPSLAAGKMSMDYFRSKFMQAAETNMRVAFRDFLNIWGRAEGEQYISDYVWDKAGKEGSDIPDGASVTVGFDGSRTGDSTVIVIKDTETKIVKIWESWNKPSGNDGENWYVSREEVELSLKRLHAVMDVKGIWTDKTYFEAEMLRWANQYNWDVTVIPQTNERMIPLGNQFKQDLQEARAFHTKDLELSKFVSNAILTEKGSYAKDGKGSKNRIDGLVGAVLANGLDWYLDNTDDSAGEVVFLR